MDLVRIDVNDEAGDDKEELEESDKEDEGKCQVVDDGGSVQSHDGFW